MVAFTATAPTETASDDHDDSDDRPTATGTPKLSGATF